jgi:hypothetical protein
VNIISYDFIFRPHLREFYLLQCPEIPVEKLLIELLIKLFGVEGLLPGFMQALKIRKAVFPPEFIY